MLLLLLLLLVVVPTVHVVVVDIASHQGTGVSVDSRRAVHCDRDGRNDDDGSAAVVVAVVVVAAIVVAAAATAAAVRVENGKERHGANELRDARSDDENERT